MGRGGAQLGKAVKGKSREKKKDRRSRVSPTSGDRHLHDDIRMLEEYEKQNQLAEAQRIRLAQLAQREAAYTRINKRLLTNLYRQLLRSEKVASLRKEIEILAQNHERDMERKDALIRSLSTDLDDNEEQLRTAQRAHLARLARLVALHQHKLDTVESEFDRQLALLEHEFSTERNALTEHHEAERAELVALLQSVEQAENECINEAKQQHETEREEIRNKNLEGINELRIHLENKIEELERQFDDAHRSYVEATEAANDHFKKLKHDDAQLSLHIFDKKKKILKLQHQIATWRHKIDFVTRDGAARNAGVAAQRDAMARHCAVIKQKMKVFRANEAAKLVQLTTMAREAIGKNKERLAEAEKILTMAELARKRETEREKVQPFYAEEKVGGGKGKSSTGLIAAAIVAKQQQQQKQPGQQQRDETKQEAEDELERTQARTQVQMNELAAATAELSALSSSSSSSSSSCPSSSSTSSSSPWNVLDNFYKKYNKVLLDKLAIATEKRRLAQENADLRSILKQYLDGVHITPDVVDGENPLLIVNGRINVLEQTQVAGQQQQKGHTVVERRGRPRVTQEANLIQTQYAMQAVAMGGGGGIGGR